MVVRINRMRQVHRQHLPVLILVVHHLRSALTCPRTVVRINRTCQVSQHQLVVLGNHRSDGTLINLIQVPVNHIQPDQMCINLVVSGLITPTNRLDTTRKIPQTKVVATRINLVTDNPDITPINQVMDNPVITLINLVMDKLATTLINLVMANPDITQINLLMDNPDTTINLLAKEVIINNHMSHTTLSTRTTIMEVVVIILHPLEAIIILVQTCITDQ